MANEGKRVGLITGGVGDLGYASAVKMAAMGLDVVLVDIKEFTKENLLLFKIAINQLIKVGLVLLLQLRIRN